jgi:hypothetical protein
VAAQPGGDRLDLRLRGHNEVGRGDDAGEPDADAGRLSELLVPHGLSEHRSDDQVGAADPARGQALAVHGGDERLDVLAADGADRLATDGGVNVSAQYRPVSGDAGVRAEMLVQPGGGCFAEQHSPGFRVDEGAGALVVLDLEREVFRLAQVVAEGLLTLPAGPAASRAVADHPLVRTTVSVAAGAALEDSGHGHISRVWSHSSTCRSRNRRYRPTR